MFDGHEVGPADATHTVILLHGLGADCFDFAPIVPDLGLPAGIKVRFVFPNAPMRRVTLNNGMRMRAWYDIRSLDFDERSQDVAAIRESVDSVRALVAREAERGVAARNVVLAGFSQGGAVAALAAVWHPERLAGAVLMSTYLLFPEGLADEAAAANRDLPVFVAHGTSDPIVPVAGGQYLRDRLAALGHPVEWHTYPMPHAVHPQEIADVGRFLSRILA